MCFNEAINQLITITSVAMRFAEETSCQPSPARAPSCVQVVAGFAENQQYGLGTNSMTGEQKSLLIYGALAVFFILFLGGARRVCLLGCCGW
jgi:hypothetical protein